MEWLFWIGGALLLVVIETVTADLTFLMIAGGALGGGRVLRSIPGALAGPDGRDFAAVERVRRDLPSEAHAGLRVRVLRGALGLARVQPLRRGGDGRGARRPDGGVARGDARHGRPDGARLRRRSGTARGVVRDRVTDVEDRHVRRPRETLVKRVS